MGAALELPQIHVQRRLLSRALGARETLPCELRPLSRRAGRDGITILLSTLRLDKISPFVMQRRRMP